MRRQQGASHTTRKKITPRPGFEPGSEAPEAPRISTTLPGLIKGTWMCLHMNRMLKSIIIMGLLALSVVFYCFKEMKLTRCSPLWMGEKNPVDFFSIVVLDVVRKKTIGAFLCRYAISCRHPHGLPCRVQQEFLVCIRCQKVCILKVELFP